MRSRCWGSWPERSLRRSKHKAVREVLHLKDVPEGAPDDGFMGPKPWRAVTAMGWTRLAWQFAEPR